MAKRPSTGGPYQRVALVALALLLISLPFLAIRGQQTLRTMINSPALWVPASLPYRRDYDWFRKQFRCEDVLLLSYQGCRLGEESVQAVAQALTDPSPQDPNAQLYRDCISGVATGPALLRKILGSRLGLTRSEAIGRLQGSFIGEDGESTCLAVTLTFEGAVRRREVISAIVRTTSRVTGTEESAVHVAGAPVDGAAIDAASVQAIDRLSLPSAALAALLCLAMLRSPLMTGAIVLVALYGQALVLASVGYLGAEMNAVLTIMPALVFVLTTSSGVHLANYFRDGLATVGPQRATRFAIRRGYWPCALATATTVIGLLSLVLSQVSPIRTFGMISSLGVVLCLVFLLVMLPGAMQYLARAASSNSRSRITPHALVGPLFDACFRFVRSWPLVISLGFASSMLLFAWGLSSVKTSVSVESLFPGGSRVLADNQWLQERVGPLISVEVILQFPDDSSLDDFGQLEFVADVQQRISSSSELGGAISAATFFPSIPKAGGRSTVTRGLVRGRLKHEMTKLEQTDYVCRADGMRSWRISARAYSDSESDYGAVLTRLRNMLQPLLDEQHETGIHAFYTGSLPVAYEAQRALLASLFRSFLAAFGLVAVVMMFVMRGIGAGLVAMLPNLFPTLAMFGLMGWLQRPVDIGAVMTASVALGIAVDDTLHFLFWWRGRLAEGASPIEAVKSCYATCGLAMTQTTLICGLGLMVYGFSTFVPTQRFAWFMLGLLLSALAGDLLFLPSLLLGPLGRWLAPKIQPADAPVEVATRVEVPEE